MTPDPTLLPVRLFSVSLIRTAFVRKPLDLVGGVNTVVAAAAAPGNPRTGDRCSPKTRNEVVNLSVVFSSRESGDACAFIGVAPPLKRTGDRKNTPAPFKRAD